MGARWVGVFALALVVMSACGRISRHPAALNTTDVQIIEATQGGSSLFPNSTGEDWATFADHLVRVTVVDEQADVRSGAMGDAESALLFRHLDARVDDVLWSRDGANRPPTELGWSAYGWALRDGARIPVTGEHEVRPEVGHTYVMPVSYAPNPSGGDDTWLPFASEAILAEHEGRLVGPIPGGISPSQRFAGPFLDGLTSDFVRALTQARPYSAAAADMDASFERRLRAVF